MKEKIKDHRIALITGASSGIGSAIAQKFASEGISVVLVARRLERLAEVATEIRRRGGKADVLQADLSLEDERIRIYERVQESCGGVDILVNNAGFGWYGYGSSMPWNTARDMLEVNVTAVVQLTILFLENMRKRGFGHIINIGSIVGNLPSQGVAVYSATKSFLDAFTTSLYREMRGSRIHLSLVKAGPVITEFYQTAANKTAGLRIPVERFAIPASSVANRVWQLLSRPDRVIYVPRLLAVTPWVENVFGGLIDRLGPLLLRHQKKD